MSNFSGPYLKKIISQYKKCRFTRGVSSALLQETEELYQATVSMEDKCSVVGSQGRQLDLNGEILVRPRPVIGSAPADDPAYRKLLYAKASENVSQALADDILRAFSYLVGSDAVEISDYRSDAIVLSYQGKQLHPDHKQIIINSLNQCTRPGVRILEITRTLPDTFRFGGKFGGTFSEREI
jgi:hypothetical protein